MNDHRNRLGGVTVEVHYPWAWVWLPASHDLCNQPDPDVEDGRSSGYSQGANRWDRITKAVRTAVTLAQHTPNGPDWDLTRTVTVDVELTESETAIVRSWVGGGDLNVRLNADSDTRVERVQPPKPHWWSRQPEPVGELVDRLTLDVANGRHRLWAASAAGNSDPLPFVDESFTYLPGAAEHRDDFDWLFEPGRWSEHRTLWHLADREIKDLNPMFFTNLDRVVRHCERLTFHEYF